MIDYKLFYRPPDTLEEIRQKDPAIAVIIGILLDNFSAWLRSDKAPPVLQQELAAVQPGQIRKAVEGLFDKGLIRLVWLEQERSWQMLFWDNTENEYTWVGPTPASVKKAEETFPGDEWKAGRPREPEA